jgi:hypothetical protein
MQTPPRSSETLPFWEETQRLPEVPDILSASERSTEQDADVEAMVERIWNAVEDRLPKTPK